MNTCSVPTKRSALSSSPWRLPAFGAGALSWEQAPRSPAAGWGQRFPPTHTRAHPWRSFTGTLSAASAPTTGREGPLAPAAGHARVPPRGASAEPPPRARPTEGWGTWALRSAPGQNSAPRERGREAYPSRTEPEKARKRGCHLRHIQETRRKEQESASQDEDKLSGRVLSAESPKSQGCSDVRYSSIFVICP
jgi:hypothetical protein